MDTASPPYSPSAIQGRMSRCCRRSRRRLGKPLSFEDSEQYARKLLAEAPGLPANGVLAAMDSTGFYSHPRRLPAGRQG